MHYRLLGKKHQLSAGLVTGGKKEFEEEQDRITTMNILVATPGRLLQHFEQSVGFDASQLLLLVLDEADRILDMGFKHQLDSIVSYLPHERQTLLFSATQTKSIKDLARLSLKDPEYLAVHAESDVVTPNLLVQNYIVCQLHEKLDTIYSFIKAHQKSKMIIFFSTCSQARYVYELFKSMQPGIPLTTLHGKIKQHRRTMIYMDFVKRNSSCMIATDIAARGLDFPDVDWVIQADAPEDAAMYIHRAGRTARYQSTGRSLLLLLPPEEGQVTKELQAVGVPIKKLTVNPNKKFSVSAKAAALLAAQPDCRLLAKKAFTGYLRSLQLLSAERCIDPNQLPTDEFAASLGIGEGFAPSVPIVPRGDTGREEVREQKNVNRSLDKLKKQIKEAKASKKKAKEDTKSDSKPKDEGDDLFTVKQVYQWAKDSEIGSDILCTKEKKIKLRIDPLDAKRVADMKLTVNKKVIFDDDGEEIDRKNKINDQTSLSTEERIAAYERSVKERLAKTKEEDILLDKQRIKQKKLQERMKAKAQRDDEGEFGVALASPEEDYGSDSGGSDLEGDDSEDGGSEGSDGESDDSNVLDTGYDNRANTSSEEDRDNSDNSQDSEDNQASDDESVDYTEKKNKKRQLNSSTAKSVNKRSKLDKDSLKAQEELALHLLGGL